MINKTLFNALKQDYLEYQKERHEIQKHASDLLLISKQIIFALHANNQEKAKTLISQTEEIIKNIKTQFKTNPKLQYEGIYLAATEEYVEALVFYKYIYNEELKKLDPSIQAEQYIGGLCDFTGELVRRAVNLVTKKEYSEIIKYKKVTEEVIEQLAEFNLTKNLRVKYDQAKRNLNRIEEILYDLAIKQTK
jgi:predicted translin family RNA/ssDNA-binding protein